MAFHSDTRPAPMPLMLTVTVAHLKPGVRYKLYRYADVGAVPNDHFNAQARNAAASWTFGIASGSTWSLTEQIMSDQMAIYRAVPAAAP